jgi:hypothetical protein
LSTEATSGPSAATSFVTDTVRQSTTQMLGLFAQSTKMTVGTMSSLFKAFSKLPPSRPKIQMAPSRESLQEWLDVGFDTTEQLLKLQRELVGEMLGRLTGLRTR